MYVLRASGVCATLVVVMRGHDEERSHESGPTARACCTLTYEVYDCMYADCCAVRGRRWHER